jgi:hypothetical protein
MDDQEETLIIEWDDGFAIRRILPASALAADKAKGLAAEDATRGAAATWGLPDFTFRPLRFQRGPALREAGDVILAVPHRAVSVQVKCRERFSDDPVRERKWLDKKIAEATRQAEGTIRAIRQVGGRELVNERGRTVHVGRGATEWAKVVVLDHPGLQDYTPSGDAVVLLRKDWEFLFEQLKSAAAVIDYLHRIGPEQIELGTESVRYYQFALADRDAAPGPADGRLTALGFGTNSPPTLPTAPAGDDGPHLLVRIMLEDIAATVGDGSMSDQQRFEVLAAIDTVPVAYREELGRDILKWIEGGAAVPKKTLQWRFRGMSFLGRPYLLFGAASQPADDWIMRSFQDYVTLRHAQHLELAPERGDTITVGILLTPRLDGVRQWDTTMVSTRGDLGYGPKARMALEMIWGPLGQTTFGSPDWDAVNAAYKEALAEEDAAQDDVA